MSRVATCPKCKTEYELDEDDIGHLMECECGSALFACHTRSLESFTMFCKICGGEHQMSGADAARNVRVDCGAKVCVPSVLLRAPVGNRKLAARAKAELDTQVRPGSRVEADSLPNPIVSTRQKEAVLRSNRPASRRGSEANGSAARIEDETTSGTLASSRAGTTPAVDEPDNGSQGKQRAQPKKNIGSTLGVLGVASLLIVAVVMFLLREPPSARRKTGFAEIAKEQAETELRSSVIPAGEVLDPVTQSLRGGDRGAVEGLQVGSELPATQPPTVVSNSNPSESGADNRYQLPPPTLYALPERKQARKLIPISREKIAIPSLKRGLEIAFEEYGKVQKLQGKADASNEPADVNAYHQAVGRTIGILEQVHVLALKQRSMNDVSTTRYLLAFLYFKAGMLPEAAVMGESVARWGDVSDPSTKEAGMIALAATQELSDLQWGDAGDLGELRQMEMVAGILQQRWPQESQNALVWMNVAYLYEAFNQPQNAVPVYENVLPSSEHHATALLASGMAEWNVLRQHNSVTGNAISSEDRKRVKQRLAKGLRVAEKNEPELTLGGVEARLALAQIELVSGNPEKAEEWLAAEPPALLSSIRVRPDDERESALLVDEAMARQLFDVMFHACSAQGDTHGATRAIDDLAELLGEAGEEVAARRISILKVAFEGLKVPDSFKQADFDAAQKMSAGIMKQAATVPTPTILWLAESWAQVGEHAEQREIAKQAARTGAELFGDAMERDDFPKQSLQAAQLRRIELLRRSGEVMQSLKQIEDILAEEPNVFTLQIAAAQSLQQVAIEYERPSDLLAAIEGPSGFSPIWGWGKLVTTLHATLYSADGNPRHAEQLTLAQYHLFWCRYQLVLQVKDAAERTQQLTELERALSKRIATMDKKSDWYLRYQDLHAKMSGDR